MHYRNWPRGILLMKKLLVCQVSHCLQNMTSMYLLFVMLMFFHFVVLNVVATNLFFQVFVAFESSSWFIFEKIPLNDLFTDKMLQYLRTTFLVFIRDRLYVNTRGIFVSFEVVLSVSFKSFFLSIFPTVFYMFIPALVCNLNRIIAEVNGRIVDKSF